MRGTRTTAAIALAAVAGSLSLAGAATAAPNYPPPSKPKNLKAPKGPFKTWTVCRKGCKFKSIQRAVNRAKAGDTIRVRPGTYRERVNIKGPSKRYLKIIGDPRRPSRVVLSGKNSRPTSVPNNGISINGADKVTVNGLSALDYGGYGFFVVNNDGYTFTNLIAKRTGVYGLYAFNSVGGSMTNSVGAWTNDSGFYVGQTPPQTKPKRTIIRNVTAYGNVIGYSGTNSRYVTITKSRFYNNGLGIVPNALDSEKYAPPEDNVISDNDVYFNNFNYYAGAPFVLRNSATNTPYPVGTGILLFGGRRATVEKNRVYGNYLLGIGALQQILLEQKDAQDLIGNQIKGNVFGNGGKNPNGRDVFYDGNGRDNCVEPGAAQNTVPLSRNTFAPCPFTGQNTFNQAAQLEAVNWALSINPAKPDDAEKFWIKGSQQPIPGFTPFERWTPSIGAK
jgi:hypothetical protein